MERRRRNKQEKKYNNSHLNDKTNKQGEREKGKKQ